MLKREDVLAAKLKHEDVSVPEWGGEVRVWEMGAAQRIAFSEVYQEASTVDRVAHLVSLCAGDDAGIYSPPLTVAELLARPSEGLLKVYAVALRVNVMSKESAEEVRGN